MEDKKLTQEQKERLLQRLADVMMEDALRCTDAVQIINVLLAACQRERDEIDPAGFISEFLQ